MDEKIRIYIEWLGSNITTDKTYHNHKENMAWVATALYLPSIMWLGVTISTNELNYIIRLAASLLIIITCIVFLCLFIKVQLTERWKSAERISVLIKYSTEILVGKKILDDKCQQTNEVEGITYPKCIADEINEKYKKRCCNFDTRLKTEIATYIMIIGATAVSILLIWIIKPINL